MKHVNLPNVLAEVVSWRWYGRHASDISGTIALQASWFYFFCFLFSIFTTPFPPLSSQEEQQHQLLQQTPQNAVHVQPSDKAHIRGNYDKSQERSEMMLWGFRGVFLLSSYPNQGSKEMGVLHRSTAPLGQKAIYDIRLHK